MPYIVSVVLQSVLLPHKVMEGNGPEVNFRLITKDSDDTDREAGNSRRAGERNKKWRMNGKM